MYKKLAVFAALFLIVPAVSNCQSSARESLRGLNGVFVYVHPVDSDVEKGGLTTSQIKSAVEAALHQAGIPMHGEPQPADGSANLAIEISVVKHPQGPYVYTAGVSLVQVVHLARLQVPDPLPAETWSSMKIGLTTANRTDLMLEPLKAALSEFISDYLAVNPSPHR